jgi:hypothetical protein
VKVRLTTATEHHHGIGKLTRVRVELLQSRFGQVLMVGTMILAGLLLSQYDLWPFSRPAVLIPLTWWAMYLVNRNRVSVPVLGLIDAAAEKAGFYPVPAKPAEQAKPVEQPNPVNPAADFQPAPIQPSPLQPARTLPAQPQPQPGAESQPKPVPQPQKVPPLQPIPAGAIESGPRPHVALDRPTPLPAPGAFDEDGELSII